MEFTLNLSNNKSPSKRTIPAQIPLKDARMMTQAAKMTQMAWTRDTHPMLITLRTLGLKMLMIRLRNLIS